MTCEDFCDRVEEYLDGVLPPEEAARWRTHAGSCGECSAELEQARAFADLMAGEGRSALDAYEARRYTHRVLAGARTSELPRVQERAIPEAPRPTWRQRLLRPLSAAAAVVIAVIAYGFGTPSGPVVLAAGETTMLETGARASFGSASELQADRPTRVTALEDDTSDRVRIDTGGAVFFSEGVQLVVESRRGTITGSGVTFHLTQDENGTARIAVLSGELAHEGDKGEAPKTLHAGDFVEIDTKGKTTVVNDASVGELRLMAGMGILEMDSLRGELVKLQEELAELRRQRQQSAAEAEANDEVVYEDALDDLPWDHLGRAAREMLVQAGKGASLDDPRRNRALAVFLLHSEQIRAATGVKAPADGLWHPAALDRMAGSFYEALAPEASPQALDATTRATQIAAREALQNLRDGVQPGQRLQDRLHVFRTMIEAVREHLGEAHAAQLADGVRGAAQLVSAHRMRLDGSTVDDLVAMRSKRFDLYDSQREELVDAVEDYVAGTVAIQDEITERLGEEDARRILFPRRPPWKPGPAVPRPPRGELTDAQRVDDALAIIESTSELLDLRVEFEQRLWDLLRPEQRQTGLLTGNYVLTFEGALR